MCGVCGMSECGVCVCGVCMCDVEVRGQLAGSSSDVAPCRLLGLNSSYQAWQQMHLPDEPLHGPEFVSNLLRWFLFEALWSFRYDCVIIKAACGISSSTPLRLEEEHTH